MLTQQLIWKNGIWEQKNPSSLSPQLVLVFGSRLTIEASPSFYSSLKSLFPVADILTTSSAGNIIDESLLDDTIIATAVEFTKTKLKTGFFELGKVDDKTLGEQVANYFMAPDLVNILVFSCSGINAGNILLGINGVLKGSVSVSGGVAGDDNRFQKTLVGLNENLSDKHLVAVAMYGSNIKVAHGSKGGWDAFGPRRKVTKSHANVLYEVDGKPALDIYKEYLGAKAKDLPGAALLFPFAIIDSETGEQIVRGVQNIDEKKNALIFYGDIHEGETLQLMRCDFDRLVDGAGDSAKQTFLKDNHPPELAVLISCVARRLVLGQLTEEELVETKKVFGSTTTICGFYSYTELSPVVGDNACHLHNQTMTITTFSEY
jgi:hypothetical protein